MQKQFATNDFKIFSAKEKDNIVQIIVSPFRILILNENYQFKIYDFSFDQLSSFSIKNDFVTLAFKNKKIHVYCHKAEKLKNAIEIVQFQEMQSEYKLFQKINDFFSMNKNDINQLLNELHSIGNSLILLLDQKRKVPNFLLETMKYIFIVRFQNEYKLNDFKIYEKEIFMIFLIVLLEAIEVASQLQTDKDYLDYIIGGLTREIFQISVYIKVDSSKILGSSMLFFNRENPLAIMYESKVMQREIQTLLNESKMGINVSKSQFIDKLYLIIVLEVCAILTDISHFELNELTVNVLIMILNPQALTKKVHRTMKTIIGEMLKAFNDNRVDKNFIYVFAMWVMKDKLK